MESTPEVCPGDPPSWQVEDLARVGASEEDIAAELDMSLETLCSQFDKELKRGSASGRNQVLRTFFGKVVSGENIGALTTWVKSRCGWRDTAVTQMQPNIVYQLAVDCVDPGNGQSSNLSPVSQSGRDPQLR